MRTSFQISVSSLLLFLFVLAGSVAHAGTQTPPERPLMVEIQKGRIFVNLDRHVNTSERFKKGAFQSKMIVKAMVWESRVPRRSIEGFLVGSALKLFNQKGLLGLCTIKGFQYLTRGHNSFGIKDKSGRLEQCGSPVLFAELNCTANVQRVAKTNKHLLALPASLKLPALYPKSKTASRRLVRRLKTICMSDPTVRAAKSKAAARAQKQKEKLKTVLTISSFRGSDGQTLYHCKVSLTTRYGETFCGANDVAVHLGLFWTAATSKRKLRRLGRTTNLGADSPWSIEYALDSDGDGIPELLGSQGQDTAVLGINSKGLSVRNKLSIDFCGCRC